MKKLITIVLILFTVFNINSQAFLGNKLTDIKEVYDTVEDEDASYLYVKGNQVILQVENGIVMSEVYNLVVQDSYNKVINLINRDYERAEYLDDKKLGTAYLHKQYKVLCYQLDYSFIFILYNL